MSNARPAEREPLRADEVLPILRALHDADTVLIGGQALNVWCEIYATNVEALRAYAPFTSKDVDAQGDRNAVEMCARALGVRPMFSTSARDADSDAINSGYMEVPIRHSHVGVNVVVKPYGLKQNEVRDTALMLELDGNPLRVMHPVLVMESRIANVIGLHRTDPHSLMQARASILCAREFIHDPSREKREALALVERIFRYARSDTNARHASARFALNAFDAVTPGAPLPPAFGEKRYPEMFAQIDARNERQRQTYEASLARR